MMETEMGYRGSKSVFIANIVKEQRVDGSYCRNNNQAIKYTLIETNYGLYLTNYLTKLEQRSIYNYI